MHSASTILGAKIFSAYLYIKFRHLYIKFRHSIKLKLSGFEWHLGYQLETQADKFLRFSYSLQAELQVFKMC